jgi:dethiobiotin synthetase
MNQTQARGVFIVGTDTGIGKTWAATRLIGGFESLGFRVAGMKPVAAGCEQTPEGPRNDDAVALMQAANVAAPYELINPYALDLPVSPHLAARHAGVVVDLGRVAAAYRELATHADLVVVEGAGGWLAPLSDELTMADIARALEIPVLLIVGVRLGCLNHTMLTAEAIARSGAERCGWIANVVDPAMLLPNENIATLKQRLNDAPLAISPHATSHAAELANDATWTNAAQALAARLALARAAPPARDIRVK